MKTKRLDEFSVEISIDGYVVSTITKKPLNAYPDRYGYPRVYAIQADGKRKGLYVHRLLAIAFIPNPENKSSVNHIDGNKSNSTLENLEWATLSENQLHSHAMGLYKRRDRKHFKDERNGVMRKLNSKGVSTIVLAECFELSQSRVSIIIKGKEGAL